MCLLALCITYLCQTWNQDKVCQHGLSRVFVWIPVYISVCVCIYIYIYIYVYTQLHICVHVCIPTYSSRTVSLCRSCLRGLSIDLSHLTTRLNTKAGTVCLCKYAYENISHTHTRSLFLSFSELTIKFRQKRALCVCVSMLTRISLSHTLASSLFFSLN